MEVTGANKRNVTVRKNFSPPWSLVQFGSGLLACVLRLAPCVQGVQTIGYTQTLFWGSRAQRRVEKPQLRDLICVIFITAVWCVWMGTSRSMVRRQPGSCFSYLTATAAGAQHNAVKSGTSPEHGLRSSRYSQPHLKRILLFIFSPYGIVWTTTLLTKCCNRYRKIADSRIY